MLGIGTSQSVYVLDECLPFEILEGMLLYARAAEWTATDLTTHHPEELAYLNRLDTVDDEGQLFNVVLLRGKSKVDTAPQFVDDLRIFLEERLGCTSLQRMKFNTLPVRSVRPSAHNIPHADDTQPGLWSMIVYLSNSVGETVFFDQTHSQLVETKQLTESRRVRPAMGRVALFPSRLMHASSSPHAGSDRVVANIVFSVV